MGLFTSRSLIFLTNLTMGGMVSTCGKIVSRTVRTFSQTCKRKTPNKDKFMICIEGNIGSGKTSLLNHFKTFPDVDVLMEPVDKWRNIKGYNGLDLMYKDASRWSLTFQTYVQLTMLQAHTQPHESPVKLMERSIYSAKYCFVENLYKSGKMPEVEYIVLTKWFEWILANEKVTPDLIVYLRTDPEVVHERVKERGRKEERTIPFEYLQSLHDLHEKWLIEQQYPVPCPVLVLDGNPEKLEMEKIYDIHKKQILAGRL